MPCNVNGRASDICSFCSTCGTIALIIIAVHTRGALAIAEPAPESDETPEFLFQMLAAGATFEAEAGSFDGVLTLINVNNQTVAFSDRPERIAGTVPTHEFVLAAFAPVDGPEDNSFFVDPPNAAFSCVVGPGEVARAVFVLRSASESNSSEFYFEVDVLYANHLEESLTCGGPVCSVVY